VRARVALVVENVPKRGLQTAIVVFSPRPGG